MYIDYFQDLSLVKKYFSTVDDRDIKSRGEKHYYWDGCWGTMMIKCKVVENYDQVKTFFADQNGHTLGYPLRGEFFDCTIKDFVLKDSAILGHLDGQNIYIKLDKSKRERLIPLLEKVPTDDMDILSLVAIDARFLGCLNIKRIVEILNSDKDFYLKLMLAKDKAIHNILTSEENFSDKKALDLDLKFRQKYVKEIGSIIKVFNKRLKKHMKNQLEKNEGAII